VKVSTSDDKKSKSIAPKAQVHVTSTPAKASEQRSRVCPKHHKDQPKPPSSVGTANQLVQPARTKEFKRKKAFRILKRLATNPVLEDYQKIQEDIAWAKAVISTFDIDMTTSKNNKRERPMEIAQPASKKANTTNRGTWSRSFAEVVKDWKFIGLID